MPKHDDKHNPDMFTRLNIAMCEHDVGTRPLECECPGWKSPSFEFHPVYPLPAGEETTVRVHIVNYGTMESTSPWIELAYNIFIGNENQGMVPIANVNLPIIPAGGSLMAEVDWTPPDTEATHACVHARAFDIYSITQYPGRCSTWSSHVNPQAGNKNVRLVPIEHANKPLILNFRAKNWRADRAVKVNMLVTQVDKRAMVRDIRERYPLPFSVRGSVGNRFTVGKCTKSVAPGRVSAATRVLRYRDSAGRRVPPVATNGLWPTAGVHQKFLHERFGFDVDDSLSGPVEAGREIIGQRFGDANDISAKRASFTKMRLDTEEDRILRLVIPPEVFPPSGRRKEFRVQFQEDNQIPVEHSIYLVR